MSHRWSVARAKAEFSRVISDANEDEQVIESRGVEVAVVLGVSRYRELKERAEKSEPARRIRRLLEISATISAIGGAELETPPRRRRASPFSRKAR